MPLCPKCKQLVDAQALSCPHCHNPLKAYGHPGIPLHQSQDGSSLCDRCAYHADDSCNFPQRPQATNCTLFLDMAQSLVSDFPETKLGFRQSSLRFLERNRALLLWGLLIIISLLVALGGR